MKSIAQKLAESRQAKGLTQDELAEKAKVNLRTIQRIENAESEPRGKTLKLICEVLDINTESLVALKHTRKSKIGTTIANGFFLLALNLVLMGIIGFLTLDSNANLNTVFAGVLLSFFIPFFLTILTPKMSGLQRMLKFGFGYIIYFILTMILHGFPVGFSSGLFPCLLINVVVLYFGNELMSLGKLKYN
ncbi:MAG: helix-turn-helix domain-containing protein [Bacteroidetes bacterium]|jgi:transcriptional regulator with XRE-family HTH domain|nr:helix-turn-helix transcriptional regulator [Psychroflexus sp.]NBC57738.1 helix-turn-helix domain-containing protein [Bacteroidota bacterium]